MKPSPRTLWALLLLPLLLLLSGCGSHTLPDSQVPDRVSLTLVIDRASQEPVFAAAQEFVSRAEYVSDGELSLLLEETPGPLSQLQQADFAVLPSSALLEQLPQLYTLELPYLFRDSQYMQSALNSPQTLDQLTRLLSQAYPDFQVAQVAFGGYLDAVAQPSLPLRQPDAPYRVACQYEYFHPQVSAQLGLSPLLLEDREPLDLLRQGQAQISEADLHRLALRGGGDYLFLESRHRCRPVFFLVRTQTLQSLTPKQQAAVAESMARAAGYCGALSLQQRQRDLQTLSNLGVECRPVNLEKQFAMLGELYQYHQEWVSLPLEPRLEKRIRTDSVKHTIP